MDMEKATNKLYHAIYEKDDREALRLLLLGADVNGCADDTTTPLHEALQEDLSARVVEELIKRGADVNKVNAQGFTPWHIYCCMAREMDHETERKGEALLKAGADVTVKHPVDGTGVEMAFSWVRDDVENLVRACPVKITQSPVAGRCAAQGRVHS